MPPPPSPILPGHTNPHVNCPLCDAARDKTISAEEFGCLRFSMAAPIWLKEHSVDISRKSIADYEYYLRSLNRFFGEMTLRDIHAGHLEKYQEWRQAPWQDERSRGWKAGPSAINHELNTLSQVLQRAKLWKGQKIACDYKPLPQPKSRAGKALHDETQERWLFDVAATNSRWKVAYWASLLTANTGAGPNEIRHLRLCDVHVDVKPPYVFVAEGLKNDYRERELPLNDSALWAVKQLLKRAHKLGASEPEHYLLPQRAKRGRKGWELGQPMTSWKKAWQALRAKAGMPELRMYDLRHHALTKIYEDPTVSEQVATEIAGHESNKMRKHYSHIRLEMKRKALAAIEVKPGPQQLEFFFNPLDDADRKPPAGDKVIAFTPPGARQAKK